MTILREQQTGNIISSIDFLEMFPNVSFPAVIAENTYNNYGFDIVFEGPEAVIDNFYTYSKFDGVEFIDGKWFTKYVQAPVFIDNAVATAAEQKAAFEAAKDAEQASAVRLTRAQMLKDSDWTQVADSPVDTALWASYRQSLRDISTQTGFPWAVVWPSEPV